MLKGKIDQMVLLLSLYILKNIEYLSIFLFYNIEFLSQLQRTNTDKIKKGQHFTLEWFLFLFV